MPLLYRALCEALVTASSEELEKHKDNDEESIGIWITVTQTLLLFKSVAEVHTSRTNLAALLKANISF